ncbi:MAG TPA: substrate-binding domain-containing protein [Planctomycetota bacterium]|nr:substrate-binding domain-containing protein [Planctomycetota bacterium]
MTSKKGFLLSVVAAAALIALLAWPARKGSTPTGAGPLIVYCAAGIQPPVEAAARLYEKERRVPIQLQYGGSGTLLSSIQVARTGDVYIAADESYIAIGKEKGLVAESIPLARLRPVIAVRRGNPRGIRSIDDLIQGDARISFANPEAASIGRQVAGVLTKEGRWDAFSKRITVSKPTVHDVANDVRIGAVDAGLVWDATARQYPELEAVPLPAFEGARSRVTAGVLTTSKVPTEALRFARYLGAAEKGLVCFKTAGYEPVEGDPWQEEPRLVLHAGAVTRLAIEETVAEFEAREGAKVERVYNGCGILCATIQAARGTSAVPDAFFACDVSFMEQVEDEFLPSVTLTETRMVILAAPGNPLKLLSLQDLARPGLRVGLASSEHSALGFLLASILDREGLGGAIEPNVKTRTPTADLLVNQMRTGSLDAAVVYEANASAVRGVLDVVPIALPDARAAQPYAVSRTSRQKNLAGRLLDALRSEPSRRRFQATGFRWIAGVSVPP